MSLVPIARVLIGQLDHFPSVGSVASPTLKMGKTRTRSGAARSLPLRLDSTTCGASAFLPFIGARQGIVQGKTHAAALKISAPWSPIYIARGAPAGHDSFVANFAQEVIKGQLP